ncbi:zinc-ribbon domain-containing protein [Haladaptatus sp. CMAA 1911]
MKHLLRLFVKLPRCIIVAECRHCGTVVGEEATVCSNCGHDGIAVYRLE